MFSKENTVDLPKLKMKKQKENSSRIYYFKLSLLNR